MTMAMLDSRHRHLMPPDADDSAAPELLGIAAGVVIALLVVVLFFSLACR